MNVILAKTAGFCFGVNRAIEIVEKTRAEVTGNVYTLGPIIHNENVVDELRDRGVYPVTLGDLEKSEPGTVIIRSHGVGMAEKNAIESLGHRVVDATCPYVKKIHKAVLEHSRLGEHIIVLGDKNHAEVQGIVGWIEGDNYSVIGNLQEAEKFSLNTINKIFIVSQTTFNHILFKECVEKILEKRYSGNTLDTICSATYERQLEAQQIASKVDAMIVIGGRDSSNTRKLFDICKSKCDNTFFLQTKADLDPTVLQTIDNVGITAGASTPNNIIKEVLMECQK